MRRLHWTLALLASSTFVTACSDEEGATCGDNICDENESWYSCEADCRTAPVARAGESESGAMALFPNDIYTVADTSTVTGIRVVVTPDDDMEITRSRAALLKGALEAVNELDGWGTTAGGWVRTTTVVDVDTVTTGLASLEAGTSAMIGYESADGLVLVPVEASVTATPPQLVIRPQRPLPPSTPAFFALTSDVTDVDGNPMSPSRELWDALYGTPSERYVGVSERLQQVEAELTEMGYLSGNLATLSVFTTQSIVEPDLEIARVIAARPHEVLSYNGCEVREFFRQCSLTFEALNFMDASGTRTDEANISADRGTYTINADVFLPLEDAGFEQPYPTSIFGHGLTGDGTQANLIARHSAAQGYATIAIDSPQHGDHALRTSGNGQIDIVLALFGIDLDLPGLINPFVLRDGWRHSNYDKLALVEVIRDGIDIDDDGTPDLDIDRLSYMGASLGAIQGSEFAALSTDLEAVMYAVGGARIVDIVQFSPDFGPLLSILLTGAGPANIPRAYVLLQTLIERGDGANWAPYVLQNRLNDAAIPHIAAQMSVPDSVVPNETNIYLARALGIPLLGDVPLPDELIAVEDAPVSLNHPSGVTAGIVQLDYLWNASQGSFRESNHDRSPDSEEGIAYWTHFLETLRTGTPELVDPYEVLGRPKPTN